MIGGDKSIWTFILGYIVIPAVIFGRNQEITCDSDGFGQKEGEGMGLQLKPAAGGGDSWAVEELQQGVPGWVTQTQRQ